MQIVTCGRLFKMTKIVSAFVFVIAIFFSLIALLFFALSFTISELDDVRFVQFLGIPSLIISMSVSLLILKKRKYILWLIIAILNGISALMGFFASLPGIFDILILKNQIYHGHQESNYTSLDLFLIGGIPLCVVILGWVLFVKLRNEKITHT
jgi:hypothetical protein